ncbi:MFS transporter [Kocuria rosea]|uniref:MFS transporter n=1 Tax=Kocuria rosea TaxID=1275 RepID=UPI0020415695|nr:MFS transporter [Kocuria rosea]MCM3688596.1 MFS transporter [Kocuria rosea]
MSRPAGAAAPGPALMVVLVATMAVGPLLNHSLSAMAPLVIADLGITEGQFGLLAAVTFFTAATTAVRTGRWTDRLRARTLLAVIFGGAAASMVLSALAPDYAVLLAAMVLSGLGQVMANPATNRLIRLHVPATRRASWLGVKQAGVQAAQLVAGLSFPVLGLLLGWRAAVVVAVVLTLVLLVHGWATVPDNHGDPGAARAPAPRPGPVRARMPGVVHAYAAAAALMGLGMQAGNVYLPLFAHRALGFDLVTAGATVSVSALLGIASRVLWARVMDRPGTDGFLLLLLMALGAAVSAVLLLAAPLVPGFAWAVWPAAVLHGGAALAVSVVVMSGAMRAVPADRVGASSGVVTRGLYAGFCSGPLVMGGVVQLTGSFGAGWAVVLGCYLGCAGLCVLARARPRR